MIIFQTLTCRFFNTDWLLLILKNFMQSQLCCFKNMEYQILELPNSCESFLCLFQPDLMENFLVSTQDVPKVLVLFCAGFLTVTLYLLCDQFITVHIIIEKIFGFPFMVYWFSRFKSESIECCDFVDPQCRYWRSKHVA